jgi:hypothetical protein
LANLASPKNTYSTLVPSRSEKVFFGGAAIAIVKIIGGRGKILPIESIMLIYIFGVLVRIYMVPSSFLVDK